MEMEEKVKQVRTGAQLIGEKLRRGILIGKREGNSTPPPTWQFGLIQQDGTLLPNLNLFNYSNNLSARKLGANLWEMWPQSNPSFAKLRKIEPDFGHKKRENISSKELRVEPAKNYAEQMPPYIPAASPISCLLSKDKLGESSQRPRTSTELLKLMNRIWRLEEKHALDMSCVKVLRRELDQSQAQIEQLLQEKKIDQMEINNLMKKLTEYRVATKKEKDQLKDAVKVVKDKVEDEHKLRRNSEQINHKLDKELLDSKSLLSNALRQLEQERKTRTLLEDLCDEFAKRIRDYEVWSMKHKYCKDQIRREGNDRLILHISEAWLDQRSRMQLSDVRVSEKQSDLDKLCFKIEGFLQAKQMKNPCGSNVLLQSLESFHLNEPASAPWKANGAPWKANGEDDSVEGTGTEKSNMGKKRAQSRKDSDLSISLMPPEEHANGREHVPLNQDGKSMRSRADASYKVTNLGMHEMGEAMLKSWEGTNRISDADAATTATATRNPSLASEVKNLRYKMEGSSDPFMFAGPQSPVKKWISDASAMHPDPNIPGTFSRWSGSMKSSSMKAKLMETRIERQESHPRTSRS